ncbi:transposase [Marinobacterium rhizophilum]|uniref:transposase n=1 Tax=Marinobacterium rhizophilum TaxID=420402 RepID=UPI003B8460E8
MNRESGTYNGKRRIRGGRHRIRTVMFMAMLSSIQCNPVFKRFYARLKERQATQSGHHRLHAQAHCAQYTPEKRGALVRKNGLIILTESHSHLLYISLIMKFFVGFI